MEKKIENDLNKLINDVKDYEEKNGKVVIAIRHQDFEKFKFINKQRLDVQYVSSVKEGNRETLDEFSKRMYDELGCNEPNRSKGGSLALRIGDNSYYYPVYRKIWEYENLSNETCNHVELQKRLAMFQRIDFDLLKKIYFTMVDIELFQAKKVFHDIKNTKEFKELNDKTQKTFEVLLKKLSRKYSPESKKNEDLIKSYFKIAFKLKENPSMEKLHSDIYSKTSWSRILKDLNFLVMFDKECEKRLNKTNLTEQKKKIVIDIQNFIKEKAKHFQSSERYKTGITHKNKPDFDEDIKENPHTDNEFH